MPSVNANPYLYFMYSVEHVNKRNEVESALGRRFECGTVVKSGRKAKFSYVGTSKTFFLKEYPDAKIIAEGYKKNMVYEEPSIVNKRGN